MTRIFTIAALSAMTLAGAASAMTNPGGGSYSEIKHFAGDADLSVLSDVDVRKILNAIHSGDSNGEKRQFVRSVILNAQR